MDNNAKKVEAKRKAAEEEEAKRKGAEEEEAQKRAEEKKEQEGKGKYRGLWIAGACLAVVGAAAAFSAWYLKG